MKTGLLGTGNVATVLYKKIQEAGHPVCMYGRDSFHEIDRTADLYIIAISDNALYDLPLRLDDKLVVHTAGSVSKEVLQHVSSNYGVLYPLQSLRKESIPSTGIPLLVDANTEANTETLIRFAQSLSSQVMVADDTQRMKLHVAAVVASNFTNHLYTLAETYCKKENLDFRLLYPLILETAQRIQLFSPAQMQTGPAARNDEVTIAKHLSLLQSYPALQQLYRQLTESIQEMSPKNFRAT